MRQSDFRRGVARKTVKGWEKKKKTYTPKITGELKDLKKQTADLEKKAMKMVGQGRKEVLDDISKLDSVRFYRTCNLL